MAPPRYLCSQLVTLRREEGAMIVNLEEIYAGGAVLESEMGLPEGAAVELRCDSVCLAGKVTEAEEHAFGWRISVEFSPLTPWSPELFRPEHLLDPASLPESRKTRSES